MEMGEKKNIDDFLSIPENINIQVVGEEVKVKGVLGEINKKLVDPRIKVSIEGNKVRFTAKKSRKKEITLINSFKAHIKNMINGVLKGHDYKLKVCSGHFPMNIAITKNKFSVKNFLGEKIPRVLEISENVNVKIEGDIISVNGINKEVVSQTAANIEMLCRIRDKDLRVFQDGIWIINKDGKHI